MNVALASARYAPARTIGDLVVARIEAALDLFAADLHEARELENRLTAVDAALACAPEGAVLRRLIALFRLDQAEVDLLECLLAVQTSPALAGRLGRWGGLREHVAIDLFGHPNRPIVRPTSPLLLWGLIEASPEGLRIDPDIAALLSDRPGFDRVLVGCSAAIEPLEFAVPSWPVDATAEAVIRLNEMGRPVRVAIGGQPGGGRQLFAAAVAQRLSGRVIRISPELSAPDTRLYMHAQRLALLTGHAIYWDGDMPAVPVGLASAPIQFVASNPGEMPHTREGLTEVWADLPPLSELARQAVWRGLGGCRFGFELVEIGRVAGNVRLNDLLALCDQAPAGLAEARFLLGKRIRGRIEGSGNLLSAPYDRADLVLAPAAAAQFDTILRELAVRERILGGAGLERHYGQLGQSILFHGPSGTGKTMAAQVLARVLDAELVRVDCASIVSKFIGETVKQLRDLFDRLRGSGAVAFFDEADSLFARRTELKDSNDRHANADTNYLLQLIEDFDGVAVLATNRKENLDPAFLRRLRYVVEFGELGPKARAELWGRHLATMIRSAEAPSWAEKLALAELTPAQIKGAALSALFIGDSHGRKEALLPDFITGIERELAKDGRALDLGMRRRMTDG